MYTADLLRTLFDIPRSLTGPGVRETISIINNELKRTTLGLHVNDDILNTYEVPSGTRVFDWMVPDEWYLHRARLEQLGNTGLGSICTQEGGKFGRKQTLYRWNLRSNQCRNVLSEVYPHLVAKQHDHVS